MTMGRKEFLRLAVGAGGVLVAGGALEACGSGTASDTSNDAGTNTNTTTDAGSNASTDAGGDTKADAGSDAGATAATCENGAKDEAISGNHGHKLTVPKEDVAAAAEKTYSIQGSSGHDHTITITAEQFATLENGQTFTVTSTNTFGHQHDVTVECA